MVERHRAWHDITSLGLHTLSDDVKRGMLSPPLDGTHGRMTSGGSCHHRLWEAHTVERRWAWHDINAVEQHLWSNDVERDMLSPPLDSTHSRKTSGVALHHRPWTTRTVGRRRAWYDITALRRTHSQTTSGVTCHHRLWTTHSVKRHRVWHAIITVGQHTRSNDVGRVMTSPPLDSTPGRTTSGVS